MAGILAGLLFAFYAPAIYFDTLLLKVTLSAFLFTLAIYLFLNKDLKEVGSGQYFSLFFYVGNLYNVSNHILCFFPVIECRFFH